MAHYSITVQPGKRLARVANRSRTTAIVLAIFLGMCGIHKFYLGRTVAGWIYLLLLLTGFSLILAIFDVIMLIAMNGRDFDLRYNHEVH